MSISRQWKSILEIKKCFRKIDDIIWKLVCDEMGRFILNLFHKKNTHFIYTNLHFKNVTTKSKDRPLCKIWQTAGESKWCLFLSFDIQTVIQSVRLFFFLGLIEQQQQTLPTSDSLQAVLVWCPSWDACIFKSMLLSTVSISHLF